MPSHGAGRQGSGVAPVSWTHRGSWLRGSIAQWLSVAPFVLGRGGHAQGRVRAAGVVEPFDEVEAGRLGLGAGDEVVPVEQLGLQRGEEALGHSVIEAVRGAAGRGADTG